MTNNKKLFSFIIIIFTILAGITGALIYFAYNITKFTTYSPDTTIGSYYIGGLYGDEAQKELNTKCIDWTNTASVKLQFQDYTIVLDNKNFDFDVSTSVSKVANGKNNKLYVNMSEDKQNYIADVISQNQNELKFNHFDDAKIQQALLQKVSLLEANITIDIGKYIDDYNNNESIVSSVSLDNVNNAGFLDLRYTNLLGQIVINPKEQFSLLDYVNKALADSDNQFSDTELSVVATGLFQLVLTSNFDNVYKNISQDLPAYAKTGLEASINQKENKDLSFYNPNSYAYYITVSYSDTKPNSLVFNLVGLKFVDNITYSIKTQTLNPQEIYWYYTSYNGVSIAPGDQVYVPSGSEGYRSYVDRIITKSDNSVSITRISDDVYLPTDVIIVRNPDTSQ